VIVNGESNHLPGRGVRVSVESGGECSSPNVCSCDRELGGVENLSEGDVGGIGNE
jgi:hypothetical protein